MKLLAIYLLVIVSFCYADAHAQRVSIDVRSATFKEAARIIQKQTGYSFSISNRYLEISRPVTMKLTNTELDKVLVELFKDQPFGYSIHGTIISLVDKPRPTAPTPSSEPEAKHVLLLQDSIRGRVVDDKGEPLVGSIIRIKGEKLEFKTDHEGSFEIPAKYNNAILRIEYIGFVTQEVAANQASSIVLDKSQSALDEVVVIAYGTTTRRLNTGSISSVTAEELSKQPTNNVLGALAGRIPGLEVNQSSGTPGSSFSLQIRGRNSITQGSEPLIIIDGIPFASQNENINNLATSIGQRNQGGGLSPLFTINPADIESIEVLKDADATAIYGSRGANGVILITTRKGQSGNTRVIANLNQAITQAARSMPLMNTEQYLAMRNEAFGNSNQAPNVNNAPDLMVWDQGRYTDIWKELVGNTGHATNAQLSLSGGNKGLQFLLGGAYYRETNVFPGKLVNSRGSVNLNLNHTSENERLNVVLSGGYTSTNNNAPGEDLSFYTFLPPNIEPFQNDDGTLNWVDGFENPYRYLHNVYNAKIGNLTSSLTLSYAILSGLNLKTLVGYNELNNDDTKLYPKTARPPSDDSPSSAQFANQKNRAWNLEPQIEYNKDVWRGRLNVLLGGTLQEKIRTGNFINVRDFPSDALLESVQAAATVVAKSSTNIQYRYQALFGRLNYNVDNKYIVNITGRRDGSSRFGPGQQFANFGAIGAAWIFSSENLIKDNLSFISFGKLRGSYGKTGNDQIGDYQFLDAWSSLTGPSGRYLGNTALFPSNLFNPVYGWEKNKKLEAAIELGLWDERILFNADYYRNRSSNQLVNYILPYMTGFQSIISNFPALVENRGWEFHLSGDIFKGSKFSWKSSFNVSIPRNTLLEFPDLESSSYRTQLVIGESLNVLYNYRSLGVNPDNGLIHFEDANSDGIINTANDFFVNGSLDPKYYGGFQNTFQFKGFSLNVLFDFKNQLGRNFLNSLYSAGIIRVPGTLSNQPVRVLDRWQHEGDVTTIEKFTPVANTNRPNVMISNAIFSDQSFIRLRSIHLSYSLPKNILSNIKSENASIYFQGANLLVWNKDRGYDPEVQSLYNLAPLKNFTLGIQITY